MTNWRKFLNDIIGGFSGDGGAAQDDSIKASLDLAHTDLDAIITDTEKIYDVALGTAPVDGTLASFLATGGTALGTRLPASKSLYDVIALDRLDHATDGLGALKALIDAVDALVSPAEIIANIFDIDMGYWTEVDAPGRVTIDYGNEYINIIDLDGDENVYVYKATAANVNDFILDAEFEVLSTGVLADRAFGIGISNGIGTYETTTGIYMGIEHGTIRIQRQVGGSGTGGAFITISDDVKYYARLIRRGAYCWLGVYSDQSMETQVAGSPVEYKDDTGPVVGTHFYPMCAQNDGTTGRDMDARIHAVKLISSADIDKYLGRHVA